MLILYWKYTKFCFHGYYIFYNIQKYRNTTKTTVAAAASLVYAELMFKKWASFLYFSDKRDKLLAFESRSGIENIEIQHNIIIKFEWYILSAKKMENLKCLTYDCYNATNYNDNCDLTRVIKSDLSSIEIIFFLNKIYMLYFRFSVEKVKIPFIFPERNP